MKRLLDGFTAEKGAFDFQEKTREPGSPTTQLFNNREEAQKQGLNWLQTNNIAEGEFADMMVDTNVSYEVAKRVTSNYPAVPVTSHLEKKHGEEIAKQARDCRLLPNHIIYDAFWVEFSDPQDKLDPNAPGRKFTALVEEKGREQMKEDLGWSLHRIDNILKSAGTLDDPKPGRVEKQDANSVNKCYKLKGKDRLQSTEEYVLRKSKELPPGWDEHINADTRDAIVSVPVKINKGNTLFLAGEHRGKIIDRNGWVVAHYDPSANPQDKKSCWARDVTLASEKKRAPKKIEVVEVKRHNSLPPYGAWRVADPNSEITPDI